MNLHTYLPSPTLLFWLAIPVVLYAGYWLAPILSAQPRRKR